MIRGLASLVVVLAFALAVAACGGGLPPAASSTTDGPSAAPLAAGAHTSDAFRPAVTFTVPDGWEKPADSAPYLQLRPAGSEVAGIHLFRNPVAASQDPACPSAAEPGVGATSTALVAWIRARPGLNVTPPAIASLGGLPGVSMDISIKDGWTQSCSFANGNPTVPLLDGGSGGGYHWIVAGNEKLRLYVLDTPGGGTVAVDVDAFDGTLFDDLVGAALPILKSLQFAAS